jgi:hypothetical protein
MMPAGDMNDLSDYQSQVATPPTILESALSGERKTAMIEKIELIYFASPPDQVAFGPDGNPQNMEAQLLVQPVWRFSGTYSDGTFFEILVQALADSYLRLMP